MSEPEKPKGEQAEQPAKRTTEEAGKGAAEEAKPAPRITEHAAEIWAKASTLLKSFSAKAPEPLKKPIEDLIAEAQDELTWLQQSADDWKSFPEEVKHTISIHWQDFHAAMSGAIAGARPALSENAKGQVDDLMKDLDRLKKEMEESVRA